jgi:uncharacterized protein YegL
MQKGKKGLAEIIFILDESGSMYSEVNDTIGGFNQFIQTQREMPGEAKFTLVKFNAAYGRLKGYEIVHDGVDLADVPNLTTTTYTPSGGTALLDAVGNAITAVKKRIKETNKSERPEKIICAILTDGEENSSNEYNAELIKKLVKDQEKKGWNFLFLGADINAWDEGSKFGFGQVSASVSKGDMKGTFNKMSYYTAATRSYTSNASMDTFSMSDEDLERGLEDLKNEK